MFTSITPQKAQHDSGYIVQSGGRYSLQYLDGDLVGEIKVDRAAVTGLFPDSMVLRRANGPAAKPTAEEKELIMNRIKSALDYWGMKYHVYEGKP